MKWTGPRISTTQVLICEQDEGWTLRWKGGAEEHATTAVDALNAVKQRDADVAQTGTIAVTYITWVCVTLVGQRVVRAIQ